MSRYIQGTSEIIMCNEEKVAVHTKLQMMKSISFRNFSVVQTVNLDTRSVSPENMASCLLATLALSLMYDNSASPQASKQFCFTSRFSDVLTPETLCHITNLVITNWLHIFAIFFSLVLAKERREKKSCLKKDAEESLRRIKCSIFPNQKYTVMCNEITHSG